MSVIAQESVVWKVTPWVWAILGVSIVLMIVIFNEGLYELLNVWESRQEYSHGYLIPFVVLFFIWQKKSLLEQTQFEGSWIGLLTAVFGLLLYIAGELSTLYVIVQYSFLIVLLGLVLSLLGWRGFKIIWVPLLILVFMIPLPNFILQSLSSQLQLISSELGVMVIGAFGISVLLEGNVIDLGSFKLQVVEACSGLRYLFPLMAFGFITAYLYNTEKWKRVFLFLSTIPITVLMNSFRIGIIGVSVEYWGKSMAEGFLHDFEGWLVFMACTGVLFLEMWLLTKIGRDRRPLREIFVVSIPVETTKKEKKDGIQVRTEPVPKTYISVALLLVAFSAATTLFPQRNEIQPERSKFSSFPLRIGQWEGQEERLEKIYVDALKFEDYIMANYRNTDDRSVNFYVAYYGSQRKGESAHSPKTCLPGGGWKMEDFSQRQFKEITINEKPLSVNRSVTKMGDHTQLVYYWFQQRGRIITNEYLVKWYIFWDSLTKQRTDGALVRVITVVKPGQDVEEADKVLISFASSVAPYLEKYIPD